MAHTPAAVPATRLLLSWAHADERAKKDLLQRLSPRLGYLDGISTVWWQDSHITVGEAWRRDIFRRIDECDFGVQLLSPAFLNSGFITRHELPPFVGPAAHKQAIPVGLEPILMDGTAKTYGIDELQIFRLDHRYFYTDLSSSTRRNRFATELANEIRRRILGEDGWRPL